jgi:hypothetical protein
MTIEQYKAEIERKDAALRKAARALDDRGFVSAAGVIRDALKPPTRKVRYAVADKVELPDGYNIEPQAIWAHRDAGGQKVILVCWKTVEEDVPIE